MQQTLCVHVFNTTAITFAYECHKQVLVELDDLVGSVPGAATYVDAVFGSVTTARKVILADFFRHGFDGAGAANYYDAGSCIDGRLTSAWNWCSELATKPYYALFKMVGFVGFDGNFSSK